MVWRSHSQPDRPGEIDGMSQRIWPIFFEVRRDDTGKRLPCTMLVKRCSLSVSHRLSDDSDTRLRKRTSLRRRVCSDSMRALMSRITDTMSQCPSDFNERSKTSTGNSLPSLHLTVLTTRVTPLLAMVWTNWSAISSREKPLTYGGPIVNICARV